MTTDTAQKAIALVRQANAYAMAWTHPAYRAAESALIGLSVADLKAVNRATGGLNKVIGRGLMAMDDDTVRESGSR